MSRASEAHEERGRGGLGSGARTILLLGLASFFTDVSSEMTLNVLPIFLTGTLGVSVATVGVIEGIGESTAAAMRLFSGRLSDRQPRRLPLVIAGYGLSALTKPLFALVGGAGLAGVLRFGDRLGKGVRTAPRDALIADVASGERRGLVFGVHRAADTAGAVLGLLLAALIVVLAAGGQEVSRGAFRTVALVATVPALLAVVVLTRVRETPRPAEATRHVRAPIFRLPSTTAERRYLLVVLVFGLAASSRAFVILRMVDAGIEPAAVLLLLAAMNLVEAVLAVPAGVLSDRLGRKRMLVGGYAAFAAIYAGFALAEPAWMAVALLLAYGAYNGVVEGAGRAFVADLSPVALRGGAYGWFHMVSALATLPASVVTGALWAAQGPGAAFAFGAVCAGLAALLLTSVRPASAR